MKIFEGLCLQPISFISRSTVSLLEKSRRGFVGEADAVRWAIKTFRKYLLGAEFTVMSDLSEMQKFFESETNVLHAVHR